MLFCPALTLIYGKNSLGVDIIIIIIITPFYQLAVNFDKGNMSVP
jgi:hypothetical protein